MRSIPPPCCRHRRIRREDSLRRASVLKAKTTNITAKVMPVLKAELHQTICPTRSGSRPAPRFWPTSAETARLTLIAGKKANCSMRFAARTRPPHPTHTD